MKLAIFVFDLRKALFAQDVLHIYQLRVARIGHTMVAEEDHVDNLRKIARDQLCMQVPRETIDVF